MACTKEEIISLYDRIMACCNRLNKKFDAIEERQPPTEAYAQQPYASFDSSVQQPRRPDYMEWQQLPTQQSWELRPPDPGLPYGAPQYSSVIYSHLTPYHQQGVQENWQPLLHLNIHPSNGRHTPPDYPPPPPLGPNSSWYSQGPHLTQPPHPTPYSTPCWGTSGVRLTQPPSQPLRPPSCWDPPAPPAPPITYQPLPLPSNTYQPPPSPNTYQPLPTCVEEKVTNSEKEGERFSSLGESALVSEQRIADETNGHFMGDRNQILSKSDRFAAPADASPSIVTDPLAAHSRVSLANHESKALLSKNLVAILDEGGAKNKGRIVASRGGAVSNSNLSKIREFNDNGELALGDPQSTEKDGSIMASHGGTFPHSSSCIILENDKEITAGASIDLPIINGRGLGKCLEGNVDLADFEMIENFAVNKGDNLLSNYEEKLRLDLVEGRSLAVHQFTPTPTTGLPQMGSMINVLDQSVATLAFDPGGESSPKLLFASLFIVSWFPP